MFFQSKSDLLSILNGVLGIDDEFTDFLNPNLFEFAPDFDVVNLEAGDDFSDFLTLSGISASSPAFAAPPGPSYTNIPGNTSTTATLDVGDQVIETIHTGPADQDWYRVTLTGGQAYDISMLGVGNSPLTDPLVRLMSADGTTELAMNDDIEFGNIRNSLLVFTPSTNGIYYISAQAWSPTDTGTYALSLTLGNENNGDLLANTSTTGNAILNGSVGGTFDTSNDIDWYEITLTAGQRYKISVDDTNGDGSGDTLLGLYDSSGDLLEFDDDDGVGDNAQIAYTVTQSGTYYLAADSINTIGTYALTVKEVPDLTEFTIDEVADYLVEGTHAREAYATTTITYNIDALSAGAQTLALMAMQSWADLAPLSFVAANVAIAQIEFTDDEPLAFNVNEYSLPGVISASQVNVESTWNGSNLSVDSYTYQTFIHEIGHALGLGHGGPYNGDAVYDVDNVYLNDSWAYSIMSYFDQGESSYFGDFRYTLGPQIADVVAIQDLYGVNTTTRNGDTVYGFNSTETDVHDFSQFTRAPSISIYDTGGTDTLDFSGYSQEQRIDLNAETFSDVNGLAGVISIARGTTIENVIGGSGVDTIKGNSTNNTLTGNAGNDVLHGGAGADVLDGGAGSDTASYLDAFSRVEVRLWNGTGLMGDAQGDTLSGIENVTGGSGNDLLVGDFDVDNVLNGAGGNDVLYGLSGNDTLIGGAGADFLRGDGGIDTASYQDATERVEVRLWNGTGAMGDAEGDTYQGIENVIGGSGNDFIAATTGANVLIGAGGNDTLYGLAGNDTLIGGAGADFLRGDDGIDTASYQDATERVEVRLWNGTGAMGDAEGDTYQTIENVIGGSGNDFIAATTGANVLDGGNGNDTLYGLSGDDTLIGSAGHDILRGDGGADVLNGGIGTDTASYVSATSRVEVRLWNGTGLMGDAQGDTLVNIENVTGGSGNDLLVGDFDADNVLNGAGGNDTLYGLSGNDTLIGGAGADFLRGDGGIDTASYESATSRIEVRLWNNAGSMGDADGDTLVDIENVIGGSGNDLLVGDFDADNVLNGAGGNDVLYGLSGNDTLIGGAGADFLRGDGGIDTASYESATSRIEVRLWNNAGSMGDADGDTLVDIENVIGGSGNDLLVGNFNADNVLDGSAGNDVLYGLSGNDTLIGGAGDDTLRGDGGNDIFVFNASEGASSNTVLDFTTDDSIDLNGFGFTNSADAASSFAQNGNNVVFTSNSYTITFVGATLAEVQAAVNVDSNAELPSPSKSQAQVSETLDGSLDLHQDAIAAFMAVNVMQSPIYQTDAQGMLTIMTEDDMAYDWDALML